MHPTANKCVLKLLIAYDSFPMEIKVTALSTVPIEITGTMALLSKFGPIQAFLYSFSYFNSYYVYLVGVCI